MSKFIRKIALLFMVCGLAVNMSWGLELSNGEQEAIDELKVRYEEYKKNTGEKSFRNVESFLAFVEFYKSYKGGEFDSYEAWKAALKENLKYERRGEFKPYYLCKASLSSSSFYNFRDCVNWLFQQMSEDELRAGAIRLNRTGL